MLTFRQALSWVSWSHHVWQYIVQNSIHKPTLYRIASTRYIVQFGTLSSLMLSWASGCLMPCKANLVTDLRKFYLLVLYAWWKLQGAGGISHIVLSLNLWMQSSSWLQAPTTITFLLVQFGWFCSHCCCIEWFLSWNIACSFYFFSHFIWDLLWCIASTWSFVFVKKKKMTCIVELLLSFQLIKPVVFNIHGVILLFRYYTMFVNQVLCLVCFGATITLTNSADLWMVRHTQET